MDCYEIADPSRREDVIRMLNSHDRNFRGDAAMPNRTIVGLVARIPMPREISMPEDSKVNEMFRGRSIGSSVVASMDKLKRQVSRMGKNANLMQPAIDGLEVYLSIFSEDESISAADNLKNLRDMINSSLAEGATVISNLENKRDNAELKVKELEGRLEVEKSASAQAEVDREILNAQKEIISINGKIDTVKMTMNSWCRFWFYLMNPEGDFEDFLGVSTLKGPANKDDPIIVFSDDMDSLTLDYLLSKGYNLKGLCLHNTTITSHVVVYAKDKGVPVVKMDMPRKKNFNEEIAAILEESKSLPAKDRSILDEIAILKTGLYGEAECVFRPSLATISAVKDEAIAGWVLKELADEATKATCKDIALGDSGCVVSLAANIETAEELKEGVSVHKAYGSGLFRTEFLFMEGKILDSALKEYLTALFSRNLETIKSAEDKLRELLKEYFKRVAEAADGMPVKVRMLDFEEDKITIIHNFLKAHGIDTEKLSGNRFYADRLVGENIIRIEAEAVMQAYLEGNKNLLIMLPMINNEEDVRNCIHSETASSILETAKANVANGDESVTAELGKVKVEIMVETDEAVRNIRALVDNPYISGYSIGSNDLARYVMRHDGEPPLSRDNPYDSISLSRVQAKVITAIKDILEAIRDKNKALTKEERKAFAVCGEAASWYDFQAVLKRKAEVLQLKDEVTGEQLVPITLSMAGSMIPVVNLFITNIRTGDYEGVNTFLQDGYEDVGKIPVDVYAKRVVAKVFDRIYNSDNFREIFKKTDKELNRKTIEELKNPTGKQRTLCTLRLIEKTRARVQSIAVPSEVKQLQLPLQPAARSNARRAGVFLITSLILIVPAAFVIFSLLFSKTMLGHLNLADIITALKEMPFLSSGALHLKPIWELASGNLPGMPKHMQAGISPVGILSGAVLIAAVPFIAKPRNTEAVMRKAGKEVITATLERLGLTGLVSPDDIEKDTIYSDDYFYTEKVNLETGKITLSKARFKESQEVHSALYSHEIVHWCQIKGFIRLVEEERPGVQEVVSSAVGSLALFEQGNFNTQPGCFFDSEIFDLASKAFEESRDEKYVEMLIEEKFPLWLRNNEELWPFDDDKTPDVEEAKDWQKGEIWQRYRGVALATFAYRYGQSTGNKKDMWAYLRKFVETKGTQIDIREALKHPQTAYIIGVPAAARAAASTTTMEARLKKTAELIEIRYYNSALEFESDLSANGARGLYIDQTMIAQMDQNPKSIESVINAIDTNISTIIVGSETREKLAEIISKILATLKIEPENINRDLSRAMQQALSDDTRSSKITQMIGELKSTLAVRKEELKGVYNSMPMPTQAQMQNNTFAVTITENAAISNRYFSGQMTDLSNADRKWAFVWGERFKSEKEARQFIEDSGYTGKADDVKFIHNKDVANREALVNMVAEWSGLKAENIGVIALKGDINLSGKTPGILLEVQPNTIDGRQVYCTINSVQVLLQIMLEGKLPPGVTEDSVIKGLFKYLPRTVPIDYDKEVRAYIEAMTIIRSAA
jgi:phosphoenolpyruvate-protein kinase (PTS system EI component)